MTTGHDVLADVRLTTDRLQARSDFLAKTDSRTRLGHHGYEPVQVIGTCAASRADVIGCAYQGLVLGEVQGRPPASATLVRLGGRPRRVPLAGRYKAVRRIVDALRAWAEAPAADAPPVVLNKHCSGCPFRDACLAQAEKEDNLSLLDRMTPKLMRKYHDKGIFTVRQLSHIYRPRRSRRKSRRPVRHSLELQALAIRTGKIHVEHLPELPRGPVELVVDLEGVPDRGEFYLAGLLVCRGGEAEYQPFWADDAGGEAAMWSALVERLEAYPDAPVYHYGSYEKKAFAALAKRHGTGSGLADRLVNVASSVYGKVYFPVRSNGLKLLGRFVGASWSDPRASGLQSLAWRQRWELTRDQPHKQSLLRYNREDCEAVRLLVDRLGRIGRDADSDPEVEFASRPKRIASATGKAIHGQFERILKYAEVASADRGLCIRPESGSEGKPGRPGAPKGHQAYQRITPAKASQTVTLPSKWSCPRNHGRLTIEDGQVAERTVLDLVFTRNGCRKTVARYTTKKGYCPKCNAHYRESLFTFLTQDGIPWENNMAERAIRQLAVQRKIAALVAEHVQVARQRVLGQVGRDHRLEAVEALPPVLRGGADPDPAGQPEGQHCTPRSALTSRATATGSALLGIRTSRPVGSTTSTTGSAITRTAAKDGLGVGAAGSAGCPRQASSRRLTKKVASAIPRAAQKARIDCPDSFQAMIVSRQNCSRSAGLRRVFGIGRASSSARKP